MATTKRRSASRKRPARSARRNPTHRPYIALVVHPDAFPSDGQSRAHHVAKVSRLIKRTLRQSYPDADVSVSFSRGAPHVFTLKLYERVPNPDRRYQDLTEPMPAARADGMSAHIQKRLLALQKMAGARRNPVGDVYLRLSVRPSVIERAGTTWQKLRGTLLKSMRKIEPGADVVVRQYANRHHDFDLDIGRIVGIGRVDPLPMEHEARIRNATEDMLTDLVYAGKL